MRNFKITLTTLSLAMLFNAGSANAGLFDSLIQSVAQKAVETTANTVVNTATQPSASAGPTMQNGCYYNLPPAPQNLQGVNPDANKNGCVDQYELAAYTATISGQAVNGAALLNAFSNGSAQQALGSNGQALGLAAGLANAAQHAATANSANNASLNAPAQQQQQVNYNNQQANNQPAYKPTQANAGPVQGDVLHGKIAGVKVYSAANRNSKVSHKLSKAEEIIYTGAEQDGLLSVQGDGVDGWVEKVMVNK